MSSSLCIRNRQRPQRIDLRYLRRLVRHLLSDELHLDDYELGVYLLGDTAMVQANETFLHHRGSTDVITFDYRDASGSQTIAGDILVSVAEAQRQARPYGTSWESEIVRYIIHGILHLLGFDDSTPETRKKMKTEENRLLRRIGKLFRFERLSGTHSLCVPRCHSRVSTIEVT